MQNRINRNYHRLNYLYQERKMTSFWNTLKSQNMNNIDTSLSVNQLAEYFKTNMQDSGPLTSEQIEIKCKVDILFEKHVNNTFNDFTVTLDEVKKFILSLKTNTAAGVDGIYVQHLKYGITDAM